MSWRDNLRPASFRGVPFSVTSMETEVGRDGVLQEPLGDGGGYFDDQGRKVRRFRLSAFVIATGDGSDYARRRDALITAVEQKGAGTLVHPTFGTLRVQVLPPVVLSETMEEGRAATFRLEFAEVGDGRTFPTATLDKPAVVASRSATLKEQLGEYFEDVAEVTGQLDYVVSSAEDQLATIVTETTQIIEAAGDAVVDTPAVIERLGGLSATATTFVADVVAMLEEISERDPLVQLAKAIVPPELTATNPTDLQAERNARAVALTVRLGALAVAAEAAAAETFEAYDDALRARDGIVDLVIADEARDDITGDLHAALRDVRLAAWDQLTTDALQLPRLVTYTPPAVTSAQEIAQLLYLDGSRANEIVRRNDIAHSGFVPPRPLRVLAS